MRDHAVEAPSSDEPHHYSGRALAWLSDIPPLAIARLADVLDVLEKQARVVTDHVHRLVQDRRRPASNQHAGVAEGPERQADRLDRLARRVHPLPELAVIGVE